MSGLGQPNPVKSLAEGVAAATFDEMKALGAKAFIMIRDKFGSVFDDYAREAGRRMLVGKSFYYRNVPEPLYSYYVPLDVRLLDDGRSEMVIHSADRAQLREAATVYEFATSQEKRAVRRIAQEGNFISITGKAAQGKSTLVQHLFLDTIRDATTVPVLVRLRDVDPSRTLLPHILYVLSLAGYDRDEKHLIDAMSAGSFTLFFDGFDEVHPNSRDAVKASILDLTERYSANTYVLTARPDFTFTSWPHFVQFGIEPLRKPQAMELVAKLRTPNEDLKRKFLHELDQTLYKEHASFLSNPLLLTIMLLTYREIAEVPEKRHLFYFDAYQALFNRHDAAKGFRREMFTKLSIDDFERVLGYFCIEGFLESALTYSEQDLLQSLTQARRQTGVWFEQHAFKRDLLESLSLMTEEGRDYTFTHRQFQEYFAARYVAQYQADALQREWIGVLTAQGPNEVVRMVGEMSPHLIDTYYVTPRLRAILGECLKDPVNADLRLFQLQFVEIRVDSYKRLQCVDNDSGTRPFLLFVSEVFLRRVGGHVASQAGATSEMVWKAMRRTGHTWLRVDEIPQHPDLVKAFRKANWISSDLVDWLKSVLLWLENQHEVQQARITELRRAYPRMGAKPRTRS